MTEVFFVAAYATPAGQFGTLSMSFDADTSQGLWSTRAWKSIQEKVIEVQGDGAILLAITQMGEMLT